MKVAELSPGTRERIRRLRYDGIIEKHEGPENWRSVIDGYNPEFLAIETSCCPFLETTCPMLRFSDVLKATLDRA